MCNQYPLLSIITGYDVFLKTWYKLLTFRSILNTVCPEEWGSRFLQNNDSYVWH